MVHIPHEMQVEIFRHLGSSGFTFLGPAIAASKQTMEAVYSPEVLKVVDLSEFVIDPAMAKTDSIYRHFFIDCVLNGNVMGNYVEALRILCQEGPTDTIFVMLALTLPHSIYATFVSGVFRICAGIMKVVWEPCLIFGILLTHVKKLCQLETWWCSKLLGSELQAHVFTQTATNTQLMIFLIALISTVRRIMYVKSVSGSGTRSLSSLYAEYTYLHFSLYAI